MWVRLTTTLLGFIQGRRKITRGRKLKVEKSTYGNLVWKLPLGNIFREGESDFTNEQRARTSFLSGCSIDGFWLDDA